MNRTQTNNRTWLSAGLAATLLFGLAHTASASPEQSYQRGQKQLAKKQYELAEKSFDNARDQARIIDRRNIDPKYMLGLCTAAMLRLRFETTLFRRCEAAVANARSHNAGHVAQYKRAEKLGKKMSAADDAARWGGRHLENKRYERAVDRFRTAVKLYPTTEYRLGLCDALTKAKQLDAAIAVCKYVLKANKKNKYGVMAKTRLAALAKAKAYMLKPAQQVLAKKFHKATNMMVAVSPRSRRRHEMNDERVAACLATAKAALAAGISPSRPLLVAQFGALKTKRVRATIDGHDVGWKHFATIPAVVKQCHVIAALVLKANQ